MQRLLVLFALVVVMVGSAVAQVGNTVTIQTNGTPTGACSGILRAIDIANNLDYFCSNATWYTSGGVGSAAFSGLTSGTNTQMAGACGTGCSLDYINAGTINASSLAGHAAAYFQVALGYTPLNPANNLTDVANPATALSSLSGQAKLGAAPTTVSMGGANGTKALTYVNTTPPLNLSKTYFDGTDWQIAPSSLTPNAQTGDYAILGMDNANPDLGKVLTSSKATAAAWTIAQAGTGSPVKFPSGFFFWVKSVGAGTVTITATTSKFLITDTTGASTLVIPPGTWCGIESNGTNYVTWCGLSGAPSSGVTAGSYTAANITVGVDGRVTAAANGSASTAGVMLQSVNGGAAACSGNACTGNSADQTIYSFASVASPGVGKCLRVTWYAHLGTSTGASKLYKIKLGAATAWANYGNDTTQGANERSLSALICNDTSVQNAQHFYAGLITYANTVADGYAVGTSAVDWTSAQTITIVQNFASSEILTWDMARIDYLP